MAHCLLVTGGCRSGKSRYAQIRAENLAGNRRYVATCPVLDSEMQERIDRHQRDREGRGWTTLEEPLDLERALTSSPEPTLLVDCLTLWINNLLYEAERSGESVTEDTINTLTHALIDACAARTGTVIFVSNELGMGIVPENALARRYRDLVGRCNQTLAEAADEVVLLCCGQPLHIKGHPPTKGNDHEPA